MLSVVGFDYMDDVSALRGIYGLPVGRRQEIEKRVYRENRPEAMAMLVTCTRIEFYCFANRPVSFESAERALGLNHLEARSHRYLLEKTDAATHVYMLSSGILSPLFGEDTIVSQISEALGRSISLGQGSSALNRLLSDAVSFSRDLRRTRRMRVFDSSIPERTAQLLEGSSRVLVIGSGELARGVAALLVEKGHDVSMTLRDVGKTFLVVPGARTVAYDDRRKHLGVVDAVVSASSGLYYTLDKNDIPYLEGKKLIDLAVPYDIPDELGPVRLADLDIRTPERDELVSFVSAEAGKRAEAYFSSLSFLDVGVRAEDVALETVRRLHGHVWELDGLTVEQKKDLLDSIGDSVRKAYISKERVFQNTKKSLE